MPADPVKPPAEPAAQAIQGDHEQLEASEWGLDWGDIAQIRQKLELTPTERQRAAQEHLNTVIRIRARMPVEARFESVSSARTRRSSSVDPAELVATVASVVARIVP